MIEEDAREEYLPKVAQMRGILLLYCSIFFTASNHFLTIAKKNS